MAILNFSKGTKEEMDDFSVVPADTYNVQVVKTETKETKDKAAGRAESGLLLKLQFKIIDGKFKGRIIFGQFNLENDNASAVEISRKQINTMCKAMGLNAEDVQDSNEMLNIPLQIKVKIKPASGNYPEGNEISFYSKYEGAKVSGNTGSGSTKNPGNPAKADDSEKAETEAEAEADEPVKKKGGAPWNE